MTRVRSLALGLLAALMLFAAGAALFLALRPAREKIVLKPETIAALDSAIAGGYLSTARDVLTAVKTLPAGEDDLLRLLKRAFEVAGATGNYAFFADLAERARAVNGRSARVREVAAYANLRAGRPAGAEIILSRGALPADSGALLKGEALLRRGAQWTGFDPISRDLLSLEQGGDAAAYASAALRTGDRRLSLDAALLNLEAGQIEEARGIALELDDFSFDEPVAAILYDSGDFPHAIARLARLDATGPGRADVLLLMADTFQALGRTEETEKLLLRALPLAPGLSWTPYSNLGLFAMQRGNLSLARMRLADGIAFFPQSRELRVAQAQVAVRSGNAANAISILSALVADNPADSEASLLLLDLEAAGLSPEKYRARLWKLFNRVPADRPAFAALSSALLAAHDWEGAAIALRQHESAGGVADKNLLLQKGMIAAMRGDDAGAMQAFRLSADLGRDGVARYDLALVLLRRGNARAAISELDAASEEYARVAANDAEYRGHGTPWHSGVVLSRMEMLGGSARLLDGQEPGARAALGRALVLDPGNLRAGLLLRKLEAGRQQ